MYLLSSFVVREKPFSLSKSALSSAFACAASIALVSASEIHVAASRRESGVTIERKSDRRNELGVGANPISFGHSKTTRHLASGNRDDAKEKGVSCSTRDILRLCFYSSLERRPRAFADDQP